MCDSDSELLSAKTAGEMVRQLLNTPSISYDDIHSITSVNKIMNKEPWHTAIAKKMTKEGLCRTLNITEKELMEIYNFQASPKLLAKISVPLSSLYCRTKFIEDRTI